MARLLCRIGAMIVAMLSLFAVVSMVAQNGMGPLGVKEEAARRHALWGLTSNQVPFSLGAETFKAAGLTARARLVQSALTWFKAYTESAAFKAEYARQRESAKPTPPESRGGVDGELAKQKAERRKSLEQMKQSLAKMSPEMRSQMEATIKQMEEMYAKQDADPQMAAMMRQSLEMQGVEETKSHQERLAEHEKKFPADPKVLIARRLREFLALSQDVDFNAQLQPLGRKKIFVNSAYEGKPENWKLCFRAGKPAVDAARIFATAWLKELQGK